MVLGDLNAKIGREEIFRETIGRHSLHERCNDNGTRLVDFAQGRNIVIRSTMLPRKIKKGTWVSPDGIIQNQIDYIIIDKRHASDVCQVGSCRGADEDIDHYLLRIKYKQKVNSQRNRKTEGKAKTDVSKLKIREKKEDYEREMREITERTEDSWQEGGVEEKWKILIEMVKEGARKVLGEKQREKRSEWFDEECEKVIEERNEARRKMLYMKTRQAVSHYREKRREADRMCRSKKRVFEKRQIEEMEIMNDRKEVRKFYQRVKNINQGYQPKAIFCKDGNGKLLGGKEKTKERWREYFEQLLQGKDEIGEEQKRRLNQLQEEGIMAEAEEGKVAPPTLEEVKEAVRMLSNNKSPGKDDIWAEMLKGGGESVVSRIHELLGEMWMKEDMPKDRTE